MKKNKWKNLKRGLSILLCFSILTALSPYAIAKDFVKESVSMDLVGLELDNEFIIKGTDYYSGMETIINENQLDHQLKISQMTIQDNKLLFNATLTLDGDEPANISFTGTIYHSEIDFYKERGGIVIFENSSSGNWGIKNMTLLRNADEFDLFPANSRFDGSPIMTLTLYSKSNNSKLIQFEGLLPINFNYDLIMKNAVSSDISSITTPDNEDVLSKEEILYKEFWTKDLADEESLPEYDADLLDMDTASTRFLQNTFLLLENKALM